MLDLNNSKPQHSKRCQELLPKKDFEKIPQTSTLIENLKNLVLAFKKSKLISHWKKNGIAENINIVNPLF